MTQGQRRSLLKAPALQALAVLCGAFVLTLLARLVVEHLLGIDVPSILFGFLHGVLAAGIARARRMASWWMPILFFFPLAVEVVNGLQLPPVIFLAAFLFLLLLFWSTFRSQVPFYPSRQSTWDAVAALLPEKKSLRVIDIGSGLGGAVLYLSKVRPDSHFTGIELAPLPWFISQVRAMCTRSLGGFAHGDYTRLNFADYDVIFAYLSPAAMSALWQKASAEMRDGTLLLSYEFIITEAEPDIVVHPQEDGPALYGWRL